MSESPVRQQVASFADPLTRMLLASDGLTTPVLEALLGTRLQVRVLRQDLVPAADIPADVADLLRPDSGGDVLVRHSCLVDPDLSPVSLNQVVAIDPAADGHSRRDLLSLDTPIGHSLLGKGVSQRRQIVHVGRATWRHGELSEPCAVKAYVMLIDGKPWCYIRECYNPRYIPSITTARHRDGPPSSDKRVLVRSAADQQPGPDAEAADDLPPLVNPAECRTLTSQLAGTVTGAAAALHLDDGDEVDCTAARIQARRALLSLGAAILAFGSGQPVVAVSRTRGDYFQAAATLNYLRAHPSPSPEAIEELTTAACRALPHGHRDLGCEIGHLLTAALTAPAGSRCLHTLIPSLYTSHDARDLQYDRALTRRTAEGDRWDCSAHLLWIGGRQRAQVRFAAQVRNPIAVRLDASTRPEDVAALCSLLNPDKVPGRLTLVTGLAPFQVHDLPHLLKAAAGTPVTWMCDPTQAEDIAAEVRGFFAVHRDHGTVAGGIHLTTADPCQVLECLTAAMHEFRRQAS